MFATGVVDIGGKFATGVVDTGGNLPPALLTLVANLLPVSLTQVAPAELVAKFASGVVDAGGKFATDVVDTGGAPWLANNSANFRKNWNELNDISGAWGKMIHEKSEAKNLVTLFN
jgi:hypothetical protein